MLISEYTQDQKKKPAFRFLFKKNERFLAPLSDDVIFNMQKTRKRKTGRESRTRPFSDQVPCQDLSFYDLDLPFVRGSCLLKNPTARAIFVFLLHIADTFSRAAVATMVVHLMR